MIMMMDTGTHTTPQSPPNSFPMAARRGESHQVQSSKMLNLEDSTPSEDPQNNSSGAEMSLDIQTNNTPQSMHSPSFNSSFFTPQLNSSSSLFLPPDIPVEKNSDLTSENSFFPSNKEDNAMETTSGENDQTEEENEVQNFESEEGHLERITKMLSGSNDNVNEPSDENEQLANASQLLAAAVAAATVAASGNLGALSPQEQWLASMAPTLLQMFSGAGNPNLLDPNSNQNQDSENESSPNSEDSEGNNSGSESEEGVLSRRKQATPTRFEDQNAPPKKTSPPTKSPSSSAQQFAASSSLFEKLTSGSSTKKDEERQKEESSKSVEVCESSEPGKGLKSSPKKKSSKPRSRSRKGATSTATSCSTTAGQQETLSSVASSLQPSAEESAVVATMVASEDDEVLREKQQQLLLANMFATLQQKLISSVFCPHCNAACANEDQLRAHIEYEHVLGASNSQTEAESSLQNQLNTEKSLHFFTEAAAAAAANGGGPNSPEAIHLKQIAEHLAMQQKIQESINAQQAAASRKRKRKLHQQGQNPTSPSGSISSLDSEDSLDSGHSDEDPRLHPFEDEEEEEASAGERLGTPKRPKNTQAQRRQSSSSKDLNHNSLLQSLSSTPLISSSSTLLNGNGKSSPSLHQHSPGPLSSPFDQISAAQLQQGQLDPRGSSPSSAAAALASIFPPGMAPFLFPQLLSQPGGLSGLPPSLREHLSQFGGPNSAAILSQLQQHHLQQQFNHHGHPNHPNHHHQGSSASSGMLNGVPVASGNSSAAAAAAAAASLRIFNPEAYCELCNKEFCNKYFLKTHKANKHGIYTPDSEGSANRGGGNSGSSGDERSRIPMSMSMTNSSFMPPTSMTGSGSGLPLGLSLPPSSMMGVASANNGVHHPNLHLSSANSSSASANSATSKASPAGPGGRGDGPNDNPNFPGGSTSPGLLPGFPGGPMRLNLNLNMINLDSYCEICQKEFCNKYFLKKHKQKIHGYTYIGDTAIPPPNLAAQIAAASQQPNHPAQLQQLQQLQMLQHQMNLQQGGFGGPGSPSKQSPSPSTNGHATGDKTLSGMNSSQFDGSIPLGSAPGAIPPEKLRSMGVINADAFCEICCKEFCNKYFLRTHKINKHGLLDGQIISGRFPLENRMTPGNGSFGSFFAPNSNSADSGMEPGQRDPASYGKNGADLLGAFAEVSTNSSSTFSVTCDLCRPSSPSVGDDDQKSTPPTTSFPSTYLLNVHKAVYHDIPYSSLNGGGENGDENGGGFLGGDEKGLEEGERSRKSGLDQYNFDENDSDAEAEVSNVPASLLVSAELNVDCQDSQSSIKSKSSKTAAESGQQQDQLQKLHSMIKGLMPGGGEGGNDDHEEGEIEAGSRGPRNGDENGDNMKIACHICKFDCENRYYLRAHLINEHGFPPTEEAFLSMLNATSGMNFLNDQSPPPNSAGLFNPNQFKGDGSLPGFPTGNGSSEAYCELCNKEFCSKYFLKTHKARIHNIHEPGSPSSQNSNPLEGVIPNNLPPALLSFLQSQQQGPKGPQNGSKPSPSNSPNSNIQATIKALAAGLVPNSPEHLQSMVSGHIQQAQHTKSTSNGSGGGSGGHRGPVMTGRNYCNICNKELCNKYFMKTHMLKMHNINIDEHPIEAQQSSTIGGVTCDICQKELCSKYFLKVHKQNTHGIYEEGSAPPVGLLGPSGTPLGMPPGGFGLTGSTGGSGGPRSGSNGGGRAKMALPPGSNPMAHLLAQNPNINPESLNPMILMQMMQNAAQAQAVAQAQAMAAASAAFSAEAANDSSDSNLSSESCSSSDRQAKLHGLDPVADAGHRLLPSFTENCQLCDRRFKSVKWLKAHMMADHAEVLAMMRTTGELSAALSAGNGVGANAQQLETLGRLCFVCGQMFADRLAMHIHLVKEHKVTGEELAMNLAGNIKMAAMLAAVAQNGSQPGEGGSNSRAGSVSESDRRTPNSRGNSPSPSASPKPEVDSNGVPPNFAALQQLLLAKQSGINPMALLAASQSGNPWAMQAMMEFEAAAAAGEPNFQHFQQLQQLQQLQLHQQQQQNLQLQQQQQNQNQFPSPVFTSPSSTPATTNNSAVSPAGSAAGGNRPSGHGNTKNPPGKFVCNQCFRTYRHSHSLQRHILASHKKPAASGATPPAPAPPTAPSANVTPMSLVPPPPASLFNKIVDANGPPAPPASSNTSTTASGEAQGQKPRNKRYRCSKCNKKFRTRELCLVHIRALHSITPAANSNATPAAKTSPSSPSATQLPPPPVTTNFTSPRENQPLLGLRSSNEGDQTQHPLPPSPSVSSEDDLLNGHNHQQGQFHLGPQGAVLPPTSTYLPQSPMDEENDVVHHKVASAPRNLPTTSEALAQKILNLSSTPVPKQVLPPAESAESSSTAATPDTSLSRPSLITVNGEKF